MSRKFVEDDLQMATSDYLHATMLDGVKYWHTPNGGKRGRREAGRLQRMGVLPGVPDWQIMWRENDVIRVLFIELKSPTGVLSGPQKAFRDDMQRLGADWYECRSTDDFIAILKMVGVPMRGARIAA